VLDCGTAPGVTGIGNDILREVFLLPGGPQFFLNLFNACLEGGKTSRPVEVHRALPPLQGEGRRGGPGVVSGGRLKVYERLLHGRLAKWAGARGFIPDFQFGFWPRSSTLDAVFVFFALLVKYVAVIGEIGTARSVVTLLSMFVLHFRGQDFCDQVRQQGDRGISRHHRLEGR
jgi:hypothetical protein